MTNQDRYTRKISAEEAKKGHIFILKDKLSFFPPRGKTFTLCAGETKRTVTVDSYHCTCRGPQLPHDHYFIRWEGLRYAQKITITKSETTASVYNFSSAK
jgi:hypothetical protein